MSIGGKIKGKDASSYLEHYLSNTGTPKVADFKRMNMESQQAGRNKEADLHEFKSAVNDLAIEGQMVTIVSIQEKNHHEEELQYNENWNLSIGAYETWGKGFVKMKDGNIEANYFYSMRDIYDFHDYKNNEHQVLHSGNIEFLKNKDAKNLYLLGMACEFKVTGTEYTQIRWNTR